MEGAVWPFSPFVSLPSPQTNDDALAIHQQSAQCAGVQKASFLTRHPGWLNQI
jgi:hypothetical protein